MSKQKIGWYLVWAGLAGLLVCTIIVSVQHRGLALAVALSGIAVGVGRKLENLPVLGMGNPFGTASKK